VTPTQARLPETTTDEIAEQIGMGSSVATSERGILSEFGPDLLKPLLTDESRNLANHNPVVIGVGTDGSKQSLANQGDRNKTSMKNRSNG